jgi:hypothetical protein
MSLSPEEFDDYIERVSDSVANVQRCLRGIPVAKVRVVQVILVCSTMVLAQTDIIKGTTC